MINIRKVLLKGGVLAALYGLILLLCLSTAGWVHQHSSIPSDWPPSTNAASPMTSKSFQEFLLNALPHLFYLSVIVVILLNGYRLPRTWRKVLPSLVCILVFLLVVGLLFAHLADHWKESPQGIVRALPLGSVFAGTVAGLLRFLKDLGTTSTSRDAFEIVGAYVSLFSAVGFGVAALYL